jgi:hypothetical protein
MTGRLVVERASSGWVDRFRAYQIVVDGETRAEICRGEAQEVEVDPGEVEVFLRVDWCKSRAMRVQIAPGVEARLACRSRSVLTALYGITIGRDDYVRLERL